MMRTIPTAGSESRRCERAFSVIELLVAVALLAVIVTALLAMFYQTQRAFRAGLAQTDVMENGRVVTQVLARDLQEMAATGIVNDTNLLAWTPPARMKVSSSMNLPGNQARDNTLQDVTFITRYNDEWAAIAYRVSGAGNGAGQLLRWVERFTMAPDATNTVVRNRVLNDAFLPGVFDTNRFQLVADGVVHFAINAYNLDTNGVAVPEGLVWPEALISRGGDVVGFAFVNGVTTNALPAFVDLELGVFEPKAMDQFRAKEAVGLQAAWLPEQTHRMHLFKQRIPIRNAP